MANNGVRTKGVFLFGLAAVAVGVYLLLKTKAASITSILRPQTVTRDTAFDAQVFWVAKKAFTGQVAVFGYELDRQTQVGIAGATGLLSFPLGARVDTVSVFVGTGIALGQYILKAQINEQVSGQSKKVAELWDTSPILVTL